MKGTFADRGAGFQAGVLLITMMVGYLLASLFYASILLIMGEDDKKLEIQYETYQQGSINETKRQ